MLLFCSFPFGTSSHPPIQSDTCSKRFLLKIYRPKEREGWKYSLTRQLSFKNLLVWSKLAYHADRENNAAKVQDEGLFLMYCQNGHNTRMLQGKKPFLLKIYPIKERDIRTCAYSGKVSRYFDVLPWSSLEGQGMGCVMCSVCGVWCVVCVVCDV